MQSLTVEDATNYNLCSNLLISVTRFGEQTDIPYSRCERTKAPYDGMKADFNGIR